MPDSGTPCDGLLEINQTRISDLVKRLVEIMAEAKSSEDATVAVTRFNADLERQAKQFREIWRGITNTLFDASIDIAPTVAGEPQKRESRV